ncbi:zinc-binding dehydrogenase [Streptomyces sp. NPDC056656]|uniref:zinc-binding dehydrogenase n=1 Tax=Streptomyces sp. NPDC056656 TaxID=3345895 RepID=UPI003674771C
MASPTRTRSIFLTRYACGEPLTEDHFTAREHDVRELRANEVLLQTLALSVDPYLRGAMTGLDRYYIPQFTFDRPVHSMGVARVLDSRLDGYAAGDVVLGAIDWSHVSVLSAEEIAGRPVSGGALVRLSQPLRPLSHYLGVLGTTGVTAFFGVVGATRPRRGETIVLSGAAGGVGSVAGQIAQLLGARVIGLAGSPKKCEVLTKQLGFEAALDYRSPTLTDDLLALLPHGPDVYFDNVGGAVSQTVMSTMRKPARVIECGQIASYDDPDGGWTIDIRPIHQHGLRLESFSPSHYGEFRAGAVAQLGHWIDVGKIITLDTTYHGLKTVPTAFLDIFRGGNVGKSVVLLDSTVG